VNNDALSVCSMLTALPDRSADLTKFAEILMMMTTLTSMELPLLMSLALACLWPLPLLSDFNGLAN
jgi:hypothetical protein